MIFFFPPQLALQSFEVLQKLVKVSVQARYISFHYSSMNRHIQTHIPTYKPTYHGCTIKLTPFAYTAVPVGGPWHCDGGRETQIRESEVTEGDQRPGGHAWAASGSHSGMTIIWAKGEDGIFFAPQFYRLMAPFPAAD